MTEIIEGVIYFGALLCGFAVYILLALKLIKRSDAGKLNRFAAVIMYALVTPFVSIIPVLICYIGRFIGSVIGLNILPKQGVDDGVMVGLGFLGMGIGMVSTMLFSVIMLMKAIFADRAE